jgi:hypothetical protein
MTAPGPAGAKTAKAISPVPLRRGADAGVRGETGAPTPQHDRAPRVAAVLTVILACWKPVTRAATDHEARGTRHRFHNRQSASPNPRPVCGLPCHTPLRPDQQSSGSNGPKASECPAADGNSQFPAVWAAAHVSRPSWPRGSRAESPRHGLAPMVPPTAPLSRHFFPEAASPDARVMPARRSPSPSAGRRKQCHLSHLYQTAAGKPSA